MTHLQGNKLKNVFLFFLMFCGWTIASAADPVPSPTPSPIPEEKLKYLIIVPPVTNLKDRLIIQQVVKTEISILMKTNIYKLVFGGQKQIQNANIALYQLDIELTGKKRFYLLLRLLNVKRKKVERIIRKEKIQKRMLLLQLRISLYELLYGKEWLKKNMKRIRTEFKEDKSKLGAIDLSKAKKAMEEKNRKKKLKKKKKKRNRLKKLNNIGIYSDNDSKRKKKKKKKKKKKGKKKKKQKKKKKRGKKGNTTDRDAKSGMDVDQKSISNRQNGEEDKNKGDKDKDSSIKDESDKKKKSATDGPQDNQGLSFKRGERAELELKTNKGFRYVFWGDLSYMDQGVSSKDTIEVENVNKYVITGAQADIYPTANTEDYFEINLSVGTPVKKNSFELPTYQSISVQYVLPPPEINFDLIFGTKYDVFHFINLDQIGSGLKVGSTKLFWLRAGVQKKYFLFQRDIWCRFYVAKSFISLTSYGVKDDIALSGTLLELYSRIQLYKILHLSIDYSMGFMRTRVYSGFEANYNTLTLSLLVKF